MFPSRAALVAVFKRFLEVKLHRVDELATRPLHHHLVTTEIRGRQQFEIFGNAIELQTVILPDSQDTRGCFRIRAVDVLEDRIFGRGDADESILVLLRTRGALFVLLALIERDHACTETETDELMTAADREHRSFCFADKRGE